MINVFNPELDALEVFDKIAEAKLGENSARLKKGRPIVEARFEWRKHNRSAIRTIKKENLDEALRVSLKHAYRVPTETTEGTQTKN